MADRPDSAPPPLTTMQIVTLLLSVYVLAALLLEALVPLDRDVKLYLERIDFFICFVFLADFFVRFRRAPSKVDFMRWGWVDLVSSIPTVDWFRLGRLARIFRILRVLRAFRSVRYLLRYLLHRKSASFAVVVAMVFILLVFAAIAALEFEKADGGNIQNAGDAFWWAFVTMTTAGYGDKYPITFEGRIIACVLMTAGVGLFGTVTAFIARLFVEPAVEEQDQTMLALLTEVRNLREEVTALRSAVTAGPAQVPPAPAVSGPLAESMGPTEAPASRPPRAS